MATRFRRYINNYEITTAARAELDSALSHLGHAMQLPLNAHQILLDHDFRGVQGPRIEDLGGQIERATNELRKLRFASDRKGE